MFYKKVLRGTSNQLLYTVTTFAYICSIVRVRKWVKGKQVELLKTKICRIVLIDHRSFYILKKLSRIRDRIHAIYDPVYIVKRNPGSCFYKYIAGIRRRYRRICTLNQPFRLYTHLMDKQERKTRKAEIR